MKKSEFNRMFTRFYEVEIIKKQLRYLWDNGGLIEDVKECYYNLYNIFAKEYGHFAKEEIRNDILEITSDIGIPCSFSDDLISQIEVVRRKK